MSDEDFKELRKLVYDVTGISLAESKRVMLASRLATRLRKLSLPDFRAYRAKLGTPAGLEEEKQSLINAVTTNKTGFFREGHQFEFMAKELVPRLVAQAERTGKREVTIWSAACSTGQEPWTIMMTLAEALPSFERWTIRILATDIDTQVLERAANAVYTGSDLDGVSPERLAKHFEPAREAGPAHYRIKDALRRPVTFRPLNFIDEKWPIRSRFDFIMCRNASIYFDAPTQAKLFGRLADLLVPEGWLFVGHAEVLHWMGERLEARPGGIYHLRGAGDAQPRASAARSSAPPAPLPPPPHSAPRPSAPRMALPAHAPAPMLPPRASAPRPSAPRSSAPRPRASAPAASEGLETFTINVGETHSSGQACEIKTLLGSCVAACLFDPVAGIGGMNHFLLPHTSSTHEIDRQRFGVHAMETLINELMRVGADRRRLQAKIFGGGNVLGSVTRRPTIGEQNAAFAREFLEKENIPVVAAHLGGNTGMEVRFHPHTGKVFVRAISRDLIDLTREEVEEMPVKGGDAELFV
jgi:chemotaxis protein methyltransferase CheR